MRLSKTSLNSLFLAGCVIFALASVPAAAQTPSPTVSSKPSLKPSQSPSDEPSLKPSAAPSDKPSLKPSSEPSLKPSQSPSDEPSLKPSAAPSDKPSLKPSSAPSLKPSQSPSDKPSLKPSAAPSLKPSAAPSDEPSLKPSASPSNEPSLKPSASPSLKPSGQPSDVPSLKPSASPSDVPSLLPSTSPSMSPSISGMPSSLPSAPPTKPMPQIEVTFDGFCMNFVNATLPTTGYPMFFSLLGDCIEETIVEIMTPKLTSPGQRILSVTTTSIGSEAARRNRRRDLVEENSSRRILAASEYDILTEVVYDILFEQFCQTGNCEDSQASTSTVMELLQTNIDNAINDGSFLTSVMAKAATKGITGSHLNIVEIATGDCMPALTINSIFPMMWYPDWNGANEGCIMDGNEDDYMRLNQYGFYLFEFLEDCCEKHFPWILNTCLGTENTASNGLYYPDWEGSNAGCLLSDGTNVPPSYMLNNPTNFMHETLDECCDKNFGWSRSSCMSEGGGAVDAGTGKWYADYQSSKCIQDQEGSLANAWDTLYDTADKCCSERLFWVSASSCGATSTGTVDAGSSNYYVDWGSNKCVKDCPTGSSDCGGLAESWDPLFSTKAACCNAKLPWKADCITA